MLLLPTLGTVKVLHSTTVKKPTLYNNRLKYIAMLLFNPTQLILKNIRRGFMEQILRRFPARCFNVC